MTGKFDNKLQDFGLGVDVEAAGWLVQEKQARARSQPSGKNDLLLIAAAQRADHLLSICGFNAQPLDHRVGKRVLASTIDESPVVQQGHEIGQSNVGRNRKRQKDAFSATVLGNETNASAKLVRRKLTSAVVAIPFYRPAVNRAEPD